MRSLTTLVLTAVGSLAFVAMALPAAVSAELPAAVVGSWSRQASAPAADPGLLMRRNGAAEIEGERCVLDGLRAVHGTRWYADFACGAPATPSRVWLDIHLLAENRIMVSRRPLGEADIYVRVEDGKHSEPRRSRGR
jgi:hypothetical protein